MLSRCIARSNMPAPSTTVCTFRLSNGSVAAVYNPIPPTLRKRSNLTHELAHIMSNMI